MEYINTVSIKMMARSVNEGFARVTVAALASQLDPTVEELADVKTAVSEAVTNSIIHGYGNKEKLRPQGENWGEIQIDCRLYTNRLEIEIMDFGKGIEDVQKAREPMYTTSPEMERSGMGFTVMEAFMDELEVTSEIGQGTKVRMVKVFSSLEQR